MPGDTAALIARFDAFADALNKNDYDKVGTFYTEDAHLMPNDAPICHGRAEIIEGTKKAHSSGMGKLKRTKTPIVEFYGSDTAMTHSTYTCDGPDTFKDIVIWKKVGGQWFIHKDIFNKP